MIFLSYVSYSVTILYFWCIKQTTIIFYCLRKWITLIVNKVTRIMPTLLFSGLWYCYKKIFIGHKLKRILSWLAIYNRLTPIKIKSIFVFIFYILWLFVVSLSVLTSDSCSKYSHITKNALNGCVQYAAKKKRCFIVLWFQCADCQNHKLLIMRTFRVTRHIHMNVW